MSAALDDNTRYRLALHATALAYVTKGWPVIPLRQVTYGAEGKKSIRPLIPWQKHPEQRVTTPEQVERWFGLTGQAHGLAIATGELLAVDLDEYKDGYGGAELPDGGWVEQHQGRGGGHVYLANPDGQRNTAGGLGVAVDTRGDGGLSVAAPTRCYHADGRVTQWQTVRPVGELPRPADLPPAPATTARRAQRERSAPGAVTDMTPEAAAFSVARGRDAWLASVHGARHHALVDYLAVLVRYRLAQGVELSTLIGELETAAFEHPDAQAGEEFETVDDAISWAVDRARATPWRIGQPAAGTLEARFAPPDPGEAPAAVVDWGDDDDPDAFTYDEYDKPIELEKPTHGAFGGARPMLYPDKVHWFQGESGSGKTWLALGVAVEVADQFGERVWVIDYENSRAEFAARLKGLGISREGMRRVTYTDGTDITHVELRARMDARRDRYGLVLIDGVSSALTAAGKSMNDAQEFGAWFDQIPGRAARMVICVDHVTKATDSRQGMAIGTQAKKGRPGVTFEVRCVREFKRGVPGVIEMVLQKDRYGGLPIVRGERLRVGVESSADGLKVRLSAATASEDFMAVDDPREALFAALLADGVDGGIGVNELAREARDRAAGYGGRHKAEVHRAWLTYYTEQMMVTDCGVHSGSELLEPPVG